MRWSGDWFGSWFGDWFGRPDSVEVPAGPPVIYAVRWVDSSHDVEWVDAGWIVRAVDNEHIAIAVEVTP